MPKKEVILKNIAQLPVSTEDGPPLPGQVWRGSEMGAEFLVSREEVADPESQKTYRFVALTVRGLRIGREPTIADFIDCLGRPISERGDINSPEPQAIIWDARQIDPILEEYSSSH